MMATYFHGGSEIQDNQQTLYVMNPNYPYIAAAYSDAHNPNNMLLLNALSQGSFPHAPPHQPPPGQPFIAIPLSSDDPGRPSSPDQHHNLWMSSAQNPSPARSGPTTQQGGLSLSLSPQQRNPAAHGVVVGSKYLKAAQELLDEVVRVHKEKEKEKGAAASEVAERRSCKVAGESSGGGSKMVVDQLLSPAQRQELQMKKAKLINMLDEVEQRYKQYQSQMQAVVTSFEQATRTGTGSAKSYTSLALRTISRQFRCLKDSITSQVKATNKSLGLAEDEDNHQDGHGGSKPIGSRLSLVDHQLRQQRALHQLGMMGSHSAAWRPQRGLPERAVSVLRAWLFEHFLHPYPKDSDKHMLAKQTGLTRSQVSNWFINARVRLWKPMVEEMYSEEIKSQERNGDKTTTTTTVAPPTKHGVAVQTSNEMISSEMTATKSPKRQRSNNSSSPSSILSMETKPQGDQAGGVGFNPVYVVNDPDHLRGPYGANGVSLTLGLPNECQNHEQVFLPNRVEAGADFWGISMTHSSSHPVSDNGFDTIDIQSRKRFAAHQLLHDFVA